MNGPTDIGMSLPRIVTGLALAAVVLGASSAHAATSHARAGATAMTQMSHEGVQILNDAGNASGALAAGNRAAALKDINMALTERNQLAMTANSHGIPKVVPVFSEMEESSTLGAIVSKRNEGKAMPASKEPVTVDAAKDQFTFIGIDLDGTRSRLQSAKDDIANNNLQGAEAALNSIGDTLVMDKISADAPLLAIRENLGIAQVAIMDHRYSEATAALRQASTELTVYSKNAPSKAHADSAMELNNQIGRLLIGSAQREPEAVTNVSQWWVEVNHWMKSPTA